MPFESAPARFTGDNSTTQLWACLHVRLIGHRPSELDWVQNHTQITPSILRPKSVRKGPWPSTLTKSLTQPFSHPQWNTCFCNSWASLGQNLYPYRVTSISSRRVRCVWALTQWPRSAIPQILLAVADPHATEYKTKSACLSCAKTDLPLELRCSVVPLTLYIMPQWNVFSFCDYFVSVCWFRDLVRPKTNRGMVWLARACWCPTYFGSHNITAQQRILKGPVTCT